MSVRSIRRDTVFGDSVLGRKRMAVGVLKMDVFGVFLGDSIEGFFYVFSCTGGRHLERSGFVGR